MIKITSSNYNDITNGNIKKKDNNILISSNFDLTIADFGIEIPRIVRDKISETVEVVVDMNLKQK